MAVSLSIRPIKERERKRKQRSKGKAGPVDKSAKIARQKLVHEKWDRKYRSKEPVKEGHVENKRK
jgi:hypothetical protein